MSARIEISEKLYELTVHVTHSGINIYSPTTGGAVMISNHYVSNPSAMAKLAKAKEYFNATMYSYKPLGRTLNRMTETVSVLFTVSELRSIKASAVAQFKGTNDKKVVATVVA